MPRGTTNLPQQSLAVAGGLQRDLCQNKGGARVTEALNPPVQGSGADCLVSALARLPKALAGLDAKLPTRFPISIVLDIVVVNSYGSG